MSDEWAVATSGYQANGERERAALISDEQGTEIIRLLNEESVMSWPSMPRPSVADVFEYELIVVVDGEKRVLKAYDLPQDSSTAKRVERLITRLRQVVSGSPSKGS